MGCILVPDKEINALGKVENSYGATTDAQGKVYNKPGGQNYINQSGTGSCGQIQLTRQAWCDFF